MGVDPVGLGSQRRDALGLQGIGDLHVPAQHLQGVVDESRAGHGLDDRLDGLAEAADRVNEVAQAVGVLGERVLDEAATRLVEDAHVEPGAAEIESCVQNGHWGLLPVWFR